MAAERTSQGLDPRWYDAIAVRISRRRFTGEPIPPGTADALREFCAAFAPYTGVRAEFVENAPAELFTGLIGSYGRIHGAPSAALFVGPRGSKIEIGFTGEALVLEATRLGLDSCWIAGAFSRRRAVALTRLESDDHVPAIAALGIAERNRGLSERTTRSIAGADSRLAIEDLVTGVGYHAWPDWAVTAVEATRRAPSGGNSQPWRFRLDQWGLVLSRTTLVYPTVQLDLGIAMLHVELGALHEGVTGRWEPVAQGGAARFVPDEQG